MANIKLTCDKGFIAMWHSGMSTQEIADHYSVNPTTVRACAARGGLRPRITGTGKVAAPPPAPVVAAPKAEVEPAPRQAPTRPAFPVERDAALVRTGGRYSELCSLATQWGMNIQAVVSRYHLVRV